MLWDIHQGSSIPDMTGPIHHPRLTSGQSCAPYGDMDSVLVYTPTTRLCYFNHMTVNESDDWASPIFDPIYSGCILPRASLAHHACTLEHMNSVIYVRFRTRTVYSIHALGYTQVLHQDLYILEDLVLCSSTWLICYFSHSTHFFVFYI